MNTMLCSNSHRTTYFISALNTDLIVLRFSSFDNFTMRLSEESEKKMLHEEKQRNEEKKKTIGAGEKWNTKIFQWYLCRARSLLHISKYMPFKQQQQKTTRDTLYKVQGNSAKTSTRLYWQVSENRRINVINTLWNIHNLSFTGD